MVVEEIFNELLEALAMSEMRTVKAGVTVTMVGILTNTSEDVMFRVFI